MLFLRTPNVASRAFGFSGPGELVRAVPRVRFLFFTEFVLSDVGREMTYNANLNTYDGNRGLSFKVRQIDKPKVNFLTMDLNQYNKKKVIYTKADYSELSLKIFDTVDNSMLATWIDYFTYYFGDSRVKSTALAYSQSPVGPTFQDDSGWGLRPLGINTQFFDRIRILAFYANTYTAFSYINPKITSIDWQSYDYSASDLSEISVNFKYEAIEYEAFGKSFEPGQYGWLRLDNEVNKPFPATQNQIPSLPVPRIFGGSALLSQVNQALDLSVFTSRSGTDLDAISIERAFSRAPGAQVPARSSPPTGFLSGSIESNFGDPTEIPTIPDQTSIGDSAALIAPRTAPETPAIEEQQIEARSENTAIRQAAIQQGLIPANSTAPVSGTVIGGVPVSVQIDGLDYKLNLTPEEQSRVNRAISIIGQSANRA